MIEAFTEVRHIPGKPATSVAGVVQWGGGE